MLLSLRYITGRCGFLRHLPEHDNLSEEQELPRAIAGSDQPHRPMQTLMTGCLHLVRSTLSLFEANTLGKESES